MTLLIQPVPIEFVNRVWGDVEMLLLKALNFQNELTLMQLKMKVTSGEWQLLVATRDAKIVGAATVNYFNRPDARVAYVTYTGGKFLAVPEALSGLKAVVVANGATVIEGAGRPAISRLWKQHFGFQEKHTVFQLKLEE
jgi:hypothetical protein